MAIYRDFLYYYGVDLWELLVDVRGERGEGRKPLPPPVLLLGLFQGLPPGSMVEASMNGDPANTGWTVEAHIAATTSDWAQVGAIASGNWKKKAPEFKPVERPFSGDKKKQKPANKQSTSVADLHRLLQEKRLAQGG